MKLALAVVLLTCSLTGCGYKKPQIDGYHWNGDTLYSSDGVEAADVVTFEFNVDAAQACVFPKWGRCTQWETGQEAFDEVGREFAEYSK